MRGNLRFVLSFDLRRYDLRGFVSAFVPGEFWLQKLLIYIWLGFSNVIHSFFSVASYKYVYWFPEETNNVQDKIH